jgi:hypothetical protein
MIKKEKIFELTIDEDDEISGIDSVSLVSEPAIEISWLAFNRECKDGCHLNHDFSSDDEKYVEHLMTNAETEDDLLNNGWVVDSFEIITGKQDFVYTDPNAPSFEDTEEYKVRYKYMLNPDINGPAIISTSRPFCRQLIAQNKVFRVEDIERATNDFGQSPLVYRGSWNCRHVWAKLRYRNDVEIVNKASVNKGKINPLAAPDTRVLGYNEPSTITNRTLNNPSPSTVRNLGLSKDKFEVGIPHYTADGKLYEGPTHKDVNGRLMTGAVHTEDSVYLYHQNELDYDTSTLPAYTDQVQTGSTKNQKFESYNDYPESVKNNACKVLRWRDEHKDEVKGMTQVGWTRANQLCNGENISEETIARMASFARHRENAEVAPEFKSTPWKDKGYVAWLGWGGTTGVEWASNKLESIRNSMSKQKFAATDEEKRIVIGPAMIPNQNIIRKDKLTGEPYFVFFSPESIKMISDKYMKNQYTRNNDTEHDGKAVQDIYVTESWIVEDEQYDKSRKYGFDVPIGSWMIAMKIPKTPQGEEVWQKVKAGELNGFSVSGYFAEEQVFSKEELFLFKVAELLK